MKELKKFCTACNGEMEIIKIERDAQRETIELSCGHEQISDTHTEYVTISDYVKGVHKNSNGKLFSKYRTKKGGKTQLPAKELIKIDRNNQKIIHKVWEQNQSEEWLLVHDEEKPFSSKN